MIPQPTAEAFLAELSTPEDDEEAVQLDPLESIAASLQTLVALTEAQTLAPVFSAELKATDDYGDEIKQLGEAYDELEAKHQALFALLAEVEKLAAPSTSKLANNVRAAIARWRNPEGEIPAEPEQPPASPEPQGEGAAIVPPAVQCLSCERYFADQELLDQHACTAAQEAGRPAADAPIEAWREYALLHGVEGAGAMNRSQIRTALGLPHFEG